MVIEINSFVYPARLGSWTTSVCFRDIAAATTRVRFGRKSGHCNLGHMYHTGPMKHGSHYSTMSLSQDGAIHLPKVDDNEWRIVAEAVSCLPLNEPGVRIYGNAKISDLLSPKRPIGEVVADTVGENFRPVRAILFDKTEHTNWNLGWHQDRTICVKEKQEVSGFGPWTVKAGMNHVAPPFSLLSRMITIRVHLDDVTDSNAPLLIAPQSHQRGIIPVDEIETVVSDSVVHTCLAEAGDIWMYATPILHASNRATLPKRRRVLQVDFSADDLPDRLSWAGV